MSRSASAKERWRDLDISVALTPWEGAASSGRPPMFVATVRWEYRVVPTSPLMRFSCVSDHDEYRDLLRDPSTTQAWYFEPIAGLTAASDDVFELVQFTVDGKTRSVRRTKRKDAQTFTASIGTEKTKKEVAIAFTYRVLVQQHGHLLSLSIRAPTKGLKVEFWYGGCGFRYVNVLDFIASAQRPRITRTAASAPTPSIEVGFDGWAFPKAGVTFVWVLEKEMNEYQNQDTSRKRP